MTTCVRKKAGKYPFSHFNPHFVAWSIPSHFHPHLRCVCTRRPCDSWIQLAHGPSALSDIRLKATRTCETGAHTDNFSVSVRTVSKLPNKTKPKPETNTPQSKHKEFAPCQLPCLATDQSEKPHTSSSADCYNTQVPSRYSGTLQQKEKGGKAHMCTQENHGLKTLATCWVHSQLSRALTLRSSSGETSAGRGNGGTASCVRACVRARAWVCVCVCVCVPVAAAILGSTVRMEWACWSRVACTPTE